MRSWGVPSHRPAQPHPTRTIGGGRPRSPVPDIVKLPTKPPKVPCTKNRTGRRGVYSHTTRLACLYWRLFLRERAEVPSNRAAERIDVIAALQNADDGHRATAANRRHHRRRDLQVGWHVVHGSRRCGRSDYAARSVAPTQSRRRCTRGPRAGPPRARRSPR